jgi:putative sterol carrier protein
LLLLVGSLHRRPLLAVSKVDFDGVATAACTLDLSDADFMAMATGQADPMKLFTSGKLKVSGDATLATRLTKLLQMAE